jgi:prolyl-tRNA editing enzyme YbaK/EbsC (Cys-tRNA(Pro) deacylase)
MQAMTDISGTTLPRIKAALDASGLAYEVWPCDDRLADTAAFCAHYNVPPSHSVNAILVRSKTDPARMALCMVPATHRLDVNRTVRKRLGAKKASFAPPEDTRALTGMEIGGVTPIGLPPGLPVWVEASVMALDYIILGGGNRTSKLKISPEIFAHLHNCEIITGLASPG